MEAEIEIDGSPVNTSSVSNYFHANSSKESMFNGISFEYEKGQFIQSNLKLKRFIEQGIDDSMIDPESRRNSTSSFKKSTP